MRSWSEPGGLSGPRGGVTLRSSGKWRHSSGRGRETSGWLTSPSTNAVFHRSWMLEEALSHPQLGARRMVVSQVHPHLGQLRQLGIPVKLRAHPGSLRRTAPRLVEHTAEVLHQAGFNEKAVDGLRRAGVVRVLGGQP